jgi:pyridoxamine 5'-phosphate oxidase
MIAAMLIAVDPLEQFADWYAEATAACPQPDAMALATVDSHGHPAVRFVLLKGYDSAGFRFFTDSESAKGRQLASTPRAACAIYWHELHRQVRTAGTVTELSATEADAYWTTRPRGAQAAATASRQSQPVADRAELERAFDAVLAAHRDIAIPRPERWRGYRLSIESIEFWQGMPDRLHDRLRYTRSGDRWIGERLAP